MVFTTFNINNLDTHGFNKTFIKIEFIIILLFIILYLFININ
jgi:hypothetical protein